MHPALRRGPISKLTALLILLFPFLRCLHPSRLALVVPSQCVGITVKSFTRLRSSFRREVFCDGVVLTATCSTASRPKRQITSGAGVDSNISVSMLEEPDENLAMLRLFIAHIDSYRILLGPGTSHMATT